MSLRTALMAATLMLASLPAHAGRPFKPEALDGQRVKYANGIGSVSSQDERSLVWISYVPEAGCCGWLRVFIANTGTDAVDVSEQSVSIAAAGKPIRVFTYAEVQKRIRRSARWAQIGAGLTAGLNSYNAAQAGHTSQTGTFSARIRSTSTGGARYSPSSSAVSGTYSSTTYDPGAAAQAQMMAAQQNSELMASLDQEANARSREIELLALQRTTLDPGQDVFGDVEIQIPRPVRNGVATFTVQVHVGQDVHEFKFIEGQ